MEERSPNCETSVPRHPDWSLSYTNKKLSEPRAVNKQAVCQKIQGEYVTQYATTSPFYLFLVSCNFKTSRCKYIYIFFKKNVSIIFILYQDVKLSFFPNGCSLETMQTPLRLQKNGSWWQSRQFYHHKLTMEKSAASVRGQISLADCGCTEWGFPVTAKSLLVKDFRQSRQLFVCSLCMRNFSISYIFRFF